MTNAPDCLVTCSTLDVITWVDWSGYPPDEGISVFRFHWPAAVLNEPGWLAWLPPDEIRRADRYHRADDRYRSLYARSLVRILIGQRTRQHPAAIRITTGPTRKPVLADTDEWQFNVAHSGDWIVLAIGRVRVGIDVEKIEPDMSFRDVVAYSFSVAEQQYVETSARSQVCFYQLWTRKEALVKATAKGIDPDFHQIPALPGQHPLRASQLGAGGNWVVGGFAVADGYAGAVAYESTVEPPRFYTVDERLLR